MKKSVKATIIDVIVALFIVAIIILGIYLSFGQKIEETILLVNQVAVKVESTFEQKPTQFETSENRLPNYPASGTPYATEELQKIDDIQSRRIIAALEILKKGVGHSSGSYFPGEGGSIIYMGHNSKNVFRRFSELQIGNEIKVTTTYGEYTYKIYDMQLIKETETDKLPIQKEKEILMVYTCYPFNNIGYATQRYVVYAELEK